MSDVDHYPSSSDSSDLNVLADFIRPRTQKNEAPVPTEDPDWVRDFQPSQARATIVDDDTDSLVNLISDDDVNVDRSQDEQVKSIRNGEEKKKTEEKAGRKPRASARPKSSLPLITAPKLDDNLSLLQAEDAHLDLSGDIGAVGRVKIEGDDLVFDIKGMLYRAESYPCHSLCVVSVGEDEAKITAVLDQAIFLRAERNLFDASETALAGELFEDDDDLGAQLVDEQEPSAKEIGKPPKPGQKKRTGKAVSGNSISRKPKRSIGKTAKSSSKKSGSKKSNDP